MSKPTANPARHPVPRRDLMVAAACGGFVAVMVGLAYASVPFYDWFCRTTGFGGTPRVATAAPVRQSDRTVTVRFDSNIGRGLPWRFEPEQTAIDVKLGEVATVHYTITNLSARPTAGLAAYNVAPATVGGYFNKITCFCFSEQRLGPGERRTMAVVFFVDPALVEDSGQDGLNTITLSYTFYPDGGPPAGVADAGRSGASGRL